MNGSFTGCSWAAEVLEKGQDLLLFGWGRPFDFLDDFTSLMRHHATFGVNCGAGPGAAGRPGLEATGSGW